MGPINCAYTPGLAVRAFIVCAGIGILRFFVVGEPDVLTLYGVQKVFTSSTQVDMQPLVTPWKSATSLKELPVE